MFSLVLKLSVLDSLTPNLFVFHIYSFYDYSID